jgi:hypothetical protein
MSDFEIEDPPWLEGIEGEHVRQLIESDSPIISVIAGPGSGKTTGIKRRVQRLVQGNHVAAEQIFVGTFTRAIAGELQAAVGEPNPVITVGADRASRCTICGSRRPPSSATAATPTEPIPTATATVPKEAPVVLALYFMRSPLPSSQDLPRSSSSSVPPRTGSRINEVEIPVQIAP